MTAPTSYTEAQLAAYMVGALGSVATDLTLTSSSPSILVAVTSVERLFDVTDVATVTDMAVLEAAATWKAWSVAYGAAVTKASEIKAGTAGLKWADRLEGLQTAMTLAEGAYFTAVTAANGSSTFVFATVPGYRGR